MVTITSTCGIVDLVVIAFGEGMKILLIKDHVYTCSINDVSERIRVITNPSFVVGCSN